MKKHAKKLIAIVLVLMLLVSAVSVSMFSTAAALGEYTPAEGVETRRVYFAMPGFWTNGMTEAQDNAAGVYWWSGTDSPDDAAQDGQGYPGWQMKRDADVENLSYIDVPADVSMVIFNNYIDGGNDSTTYEFKCARMTESASCSDLYQGDSLSYPKEFWDYIYDNYYDSFLEDNDYKITEFGGYADNFRYVEDDDNIAHTVDNMVYVADYDSVSYAINGNKQNDGAFYFYYGNGEFGLWPTKELLTSREGVRFDRNGDAVLDGETTNMFDFITRERTDAYDQTTKKDFVVYGKLDGEYRDFTEAPDEDVTYYPEDPSEEPTVEPATISVDPDFEPDPNKIYFQETGIWRNFKNITVFIYEHGGDELITWGSKKGNMTDEGNGLWSFDFNAKGIMLDNNKQYGLIFTADWSGQSCDIIFDKTCLGDIAYCDNETVENNVDSNRKSNVVKWYKSDPAKYGNPICITSIGNVIGNAFWKGDTAESLLTSFLLSDGADGIRNAVRYNGKSIRQTAFDTGEYLGLSEDEVEALADQIGFDLDSSGYDPYDPTYDPYDPTYYPYEETDTDVVARMILNNIDDPEFTSPENLKALLKEYSVTADEVDESLYYYAWSYDEYKKASELVYDNASLKGDVNNDGVVDVMDAALIQKFAVGKIVSFD